MATYLLDNIGSLVDPEVGIIRRITKLPRDAGAPDFVHISAETCNLKVLNPSQRLEFFIGTGVATDCSRAMAKAVGEALERYCCCNFNLEDFPLSTFESAPFPCVPPEEFALFSSAQYRQPDFCYEPFTRKTPVRWVPAMDLTTRETRYVPAAMVFLPYDQLDTGETPITQQISTGLACHSDGTLAALASIYEVVERDAIAITWQAHLPRQRIRLDTLSQKNKQLIRKLERPGSSIMLLHFAMDHGIPVIFSLMTSTVPEAPALVVAAAARLDPEEAVHKSLEELAQISSFAQSMKSQRGKFVPGKRWEHVIEPDAHAALYYDPGMLRVAEFLWNSRDDIGFGEIANYALQDPRRDLRLVVGKIHAVKHRVLLADISTEDVRSLGLCVTRAVIPGFHPLFMGHDVRALGGTRLWTVPQQLGFQALTCEQDANPAPHPFA